MRYNLFDGGNYLRRPEDQMFSGYSETYNVEPAIHHKNRNVQIEQHWDTQGRAMRGNYEGLGEKDAQTSNIGTGDELVSHLIGAGWQLKSVAYHVKRAGAGTLTPKVELLQYDAEGKPVASVQYPVVDPMGVPLVIDMAEPGFYVGLVPMPATAAPVAGAPAAGSDDGPAGDGVMTIDYVIPETTVAGVTFNVTNSAGNAAGTATGDVVIPARTIQIDVPMGAAAEGAGAALPVPMLTQTNGYLVNVFTAEKNDDEEDMPWDACVGIYLDLVNFLDENPCDCAPTPCETMYPDPQCMPL